MSSADPYGCAGERWECWMLLGDFERAWQESDFIASNPRADPHRFWNGESWEGRRVMLRCLHGLGDAVQFIRYASLLRETCSGLIVQAHPELTRLLRQVPGVDQVVSWGPDYREDRSCWDIQMEIMELPRVFRTTVHDIPVEVPYIKVPVASAISDRKLRVGIVWESSAWDNSRSIPFVFIERLLQLEGCEFVSLQKDSTNDKADVLDAAILTATMDLVISVDTMIAHLAGALGIPVWIMLPSKSDWRWMIERTDSPWYPSARLFRQTDDTGWEPLVRNVAEALREACCRRSFRGSAQRFFQAPQ